MFMEKLKGKLKNNEITIRRISLFVMFLLSGYLIFLFIGFLFNLFLPSFFYLMLELSTPLLFSSKVSLNLLGFLFPLAVSVVLSIKAFRIHSPKGCGLFRYSIIILAIFLILDTLYGMFSGNQLKPIYKSGGGPNIPALFIVPIFVAIWIAMDARKIGHLITYVFGFLIGVVSDVEGIPHLIKSTVFGGNGILDLDFVLPILLSLSFVLAFKMSSKYSHQ